MSLSKTRARKIIEENYWQLFWTYVQYSEGHSFTLKIRHSLTHFYGYIRKSHFEIRYLKRMFSQEWTSKTKSEKMRHINSIKYDFLRWLFRGSENFLKN